MRGKHHVITPPADRYWRRQLENPVIAGSAEHLINADGIRRALQAGDGAIIGEIHQ